MSFLILLFLSLVGFRQSLASFSTSTDAPFSSTNSGFDPIPIEDVRFFLDLYNDDVINAYPLDLCVPNGEGDDSQNVIYTCINNNYTVVRTKYEDDSCTNEIENSATTFTLANVTDSGLYFFECVGINSYVGVDYCVNMETDECNDCLASGTRYTVVNFCFNADDGKNKSDSSKYDAVTDATDEFVCTLCNENSTTYFSIPFSGTTNFSAVPKLTSYPYCSLYDEVEVLGVSVNVNSQLKECVINSEIQYSREPTTQPTASPNGIETTIDTTREPGDKSKGLINNLSNFILLLLVVVCGGLVV